MRDLNYRGIVLPAENAFSTRIGVYIFEFAGLETQKPIGISGTSKEKKKRRAASPDREKAFPLFLILLQKEARKRRKNESRFGQ